MFSKAKVTRFNEVVGCAPPPTKYNTKVDPKIQNVVFDKSGRFIDGKENTPGPNAYMGVMLKPALTPRKKMQSVPKLNISVCSSNSASSQGFLSPPPPLMRSKSLRTSKQKIAKESDLQNKIQELKSEREVLQSKVEDLEEKMLGLKIDVVKVSEKKVLCESSTQVDESFDTRDSSQEEASASTPNCITVSVEQYQLMKDELEHLTLLRDNLENSIAKKEDIIADLHSQVDLMVDEAQEHQNNSIYFKEEVDKLLDKLNRTAEERKISQIKVTSLIAKYEEIISQHCNEEQTYRNKIAQKDVAIELLNDSISTLSIKISEYGNQLAKIPNLEMRIGDLSLESKEKEVMGTLLQSELNEKYTQVEKLEESLLGVEKIVNSVQEERNNLVASLCEEQKIRKEMALELDRLRIQSKESEVLQQFLEKEITSREAEISEYSLRIQSLESDFESTKQLAMDLQQDAEAQLNQLFCLKASLSAKEYDIEAKDEEIEELHMQISKKCQEKCGDHNGSKNSNVLLLEEELHGAREFLRSARENTTQLEEELVHLLSEIGEREEVHKKRILEKDSELEELSVKYSDALLEQDAIKRVLNHTSEELEKEKMIINATDMELKMVKNEFKNKVEQNLQLERSIKELTLKLTHLEDAIACEEAESTSVQEKLQEKINNIKETLNITKDELVSVKASNTGFMSQITQLRIDMHKKCCAVDEMQGCIDALRQEKLEVNSSYNELRNSFNDKETLLTDLQDEFESKLANITELQDQVKEKDSQIMEKNEQLQNLSNQGSKLTLEMEESECLYSSRIEDAKAQWMKEQKLRIALEAKVEEIQTDLCSVREEREKVINNMSSTLSERTVQISELEKHIHEIETKYEGYDDQIKNLQISLTEKTIEVDRFERSHNEINLAVECQQENSFQLKEHLKKLEQDQVFLNKLLEDRDQMLSDLNYSMLLKTDKLDELRKEFSQKDIKICALEENLIVIKQQLESGVNERESNNENITELSDILKHKQDKETSLRQTMEHLMEELDNMKIERTMNENDLQQIRESLQKDVNSWRNKFEYLEKMIEPFKEQLSAYDLERASLVSESSAAQHELEKLSHDYARLLGHTNHKQKIQHVAKIKEENIQLKKEVSKMRHDIDSLRQVYRKLEEQTGARTKTSHSLSRRGNKENAGPQGLDLSPLRSSNKLNRI